MRVAIVDSVLPFVLERTLDADFERQVTVWAHLWVCAGHLLGSVAGGW
jgi:hypothetical protein